MLRARAVIHASVLLLSAARLCAQEGQTPWHVPIPAEGPQVGIVVWTDVGRFTTQFPPDGRLLVMPMFTDVALFAQAGYRPALLLQPAMAEDPRVQRALKLCDYQSLALPVTEQTDLQRFALLVVPEVPRLRSAAGLVPILERYVKAGGKVIYSRLSGKDTEEDRRFAGVESTDMSRVPFALEPTADHPLLAGIQFPLVGSWPTPDFWAYRDGWKRGTSVLRYAGGWPTALTLRQEGQGQVAFLNLTTFTAAKMGLNRNGFTLNDLILRTADWMTGSHPEGPRPTSKEQVQQLKGTDALKSDGPEAVLFSARFGKPEDLDAWSIWDAPGAQADSGVQKSEWWIDTNMGALVQSTGIWSNRGVGTRATVGKPEWTDYVVSTTVAPFADGEFGIVFRVQDPDNYYRFMLDANTIARVRLEKRQNGQLSQLAGVDRPYLPGVPVRYQIEARGNTFVVYASGKELMRATDDALSTGKAGIETSGADLAVYDFQVASPPSAPGGALTNRAPAVAAPATPTSPGASSPPRLLADWETGEVPAIGITAAKRTDGKGSCGRLDVGRPFARLTRVPADWSRVAEVSLWIRSERPTGEKVSLLLPSNDPATPGTDRYAVAFVVDWTGWKRLRWKRADFRPEGRPIGWRHIDSLTLAGERWGKPGAAALWIDDVTLSLAPAAGR